MTTKTDLEVKLAALLLLEEGELAVSDIEALPFVDDYELARAIASELASRFDAEIEQRKTQSGVMSQWEDFVLLKYPVTTRQLRESKQGLSRDDFKELLENVSRVPFE